MKTTLVAVPYNTVKSSRNNNNTSSSSPSVSDIISWSKTKYPSSQFYSVPAGTVSDANSAYSRGVKFVGSLDDASGNSLVMLMSTNIGFTADLVKTCDERTTVAVNVTTATGGGVSRGQVYQPVPYHVYPAAVRTGGKALPPIDKTNLQHLRGYWDPWLVDSHTTSSDSLAPACGRLKLFLRTLNGASGTSVNLRDSVYNLVYSGKIDILRVPDPDLIGVTPKR